MPERPLLLLECPLVEIIDPPGNADHPGIAQFISMTDAIQTTVAGLTHESLGIHPDTIPIHENRFT